MATVWSDRDPQFNYITYGFDVRGSMPIDRRIILTKDQMLDLSKAPYSNLMPRSYFALLSGSNGVTKIYVYNQDNGYVEPDLIEFPEKIGKFRLYKDAFKLASRLYKDATVESYEADKDGIIYIQSPIWYIKAFTNEDLGDKEEYEYIDPDGRRLKITVCLAEVKTDHTMEEIIKHVTEDGLPIDMITYRVKEEVIDSRPVPYVMHCSRIGKFGDSRLNVPDKYLDEYIEKYFSKALDDKDEFLRFGPDDYGDSTFLYKSADWFSSRQYCYLTTNTYTGNLLCIKVNISKFSS